MRRNPVTLTAVLLAASVLFAVCSSAALPAQKPSPSPTESRAAKPAGSTPEPKAAEATLAQKSPESKPEQKAAQAKPAPAGPAQRTRIRLPVLEGTQMFIYKVMQDQKLAEKYNLNVELRPVASPVALNTALISKEADFAVAGWLTVALYRTQGEGLRIVYPFGMPDTNVIVKKGSPIKNLGDLKGKAIGIYGGPAAATTGLFRAICVRFFGFDPVKDSKVNFGAAPLMGAMLDKGDVDAILMLNPQLTKMLLTGQYADLGNLGVIWKQKTGAVVMNTALTTNDDFAKKNPAAVKAFVKAMSESIDYASSHPEIWPALARSVGIDTPEGADMLRKQQISIWFNKMDQKFINEQKQYAEALISIMGKDFLPHYPEDVFTLDFVP